MEKLYIFCCGVFYLTVVIFFNFTVEKMNNIFSHYYTYTNILVCFKMLVIEYIGSYRLVQATNPFVISTSFVLDSGFLE